MAKIDTSKIEGYESMTPEEKLAALEAFEAPEPDYSGYVKKDLYDRTSSELSALKKQNKDKLSEEERLAQEHKEKVESLEALVAEYKRDKAIADNKAKFIAQGYSEDLAEDTAKAMADGDTAKVFANMEKFLTDHDKALKAEMLKDTPKPPAGDGSDGMTLEKLRKLSDEDYNKFAIEHPEEYKALYEKGE